MLYKEIKRCRTVDPANAEVEEDDQPLTPLWLDGTLWIDEHSEEAVLRHGGSHGQGDKVVASLPLGADGKLDMEKGQHVKPTPTTKPKYGKHADAVFAICAPTFLQPVTKVSRRMGCKAHPLSYTGFTVVGMKAYQKHLQDEFRRVKGLAYPFKGTKINGLPVTKKGHTFKTDNPYKETFGDEWKNHLPDSFKYMCITDVMDWAIEEGNRLFKGSTHAQDWVIYHDRLHQWWEVEAQEYLASHPKGDFRARQWRFQGATNRKVSKYYRNSLAGDSPELMPLDSSVFSYLVEGVSKHVISTAHRQDGQFKRTNEYILITRIIRGRISTSALGVVD